MGEFASKIPSDFMYVTNAMTLYFMSHADDPFETMLSRTASSHPKSEDFGVDRSGAGWQKLDNFVITSGFVRVLGAFEQFQMDTLKALLYYRPNGALGHSADQEVFEVTEDVITEMPEGDTDFYQKPVLWTWLRKPAENRTERRKILSSAYDIHLFPPEGRVDKNTRLDLWYEKRNAIAHGRALVEMKLDEFCHAEILVTESIRWVTGSCKEKLGLII
jgi:hypothetical protein